MAFEAAFEVQDRDFAAFVVARFFPECHLDCECRSIVVDIDGDGLG